MSRGFESVVCEAATKRMRLFEGWWLGCPAVVSADLRRVLAIALTLETDTVDTRSSQADPASTALTVLCLSVVKLAGKLVEPELSA